VVLERVRAAAGAGATVELYGSSVYAPAHADDVDVLVINADPARLAAALGLELLPTTPPRLTGELDGMAVDVTIVNGDDELARRMRAGPRDAAMIATQLRGRDEAFQAAWPHVRHFVRARALGQNGLGYFGSFGWALLLAIPIVGELRAVEAGAVLPAWLRWLAKLALGSRVSFDGISRGVESLVIDAPTPPTRDVARLSKRAAGALIAEARAAVAMIGNATTDAAASERIVDLAVQPPPGTTLVIAGDEEHVRGRYDGLARGLLRELDPLGAVRSWGRFDPTPFGGWQHRITVPRARAQEARERIDQWLALHNLDASLVG